MYDSDRDFYVTPPDLVARMLSEVDLDIVNAILEPSAGTGAIADAIKRRIDSRYGYRDRATIDCIELDPERQSVLRGKGHVVVHDDFLSYRTVKQYDLIVANLPFSQGARHLLHAIDLLRAGGGQLVVLVNAETIRNPYTRERERVVGELRVLDAVIDYVAGAFTDVERSTDVEVALITVRVPAAAQPTLLLDDLRDATDDREPDVTAQRQLVDADPTRNLLARFDLECRAGARLLSEYDALQPLLLDRLALGEGEEAQKYASPIIKLDLNTNYGESRVNAYVRAVRHKYWSALIRNDEFRKSYTSAILKALDGKLEQLAHKDFTAYNIRALDAELRAELPGSIEEAILDLFDELSRKYAYIDGTGNNVHYYTGWKTNRAHKINRKVILPINGYGAYSFDRGRLDTWRIGERMADMVKVFQYLDGAPYGGLSVGHVLDIASCTGQTRNLDFGYFTATFYKKGTCHITFTDQALLDTFNIFGSQRKGWLPPSYGRKQYRDMSPEERAVVDDFQGEAAYAEVMRNSDYYLTERKTLALVG